MILIITSSCNHWIKLGDNRYNTYKFTFIPGDTTTLRQNTNYDRPNTVDEASNEGLNFKIKDRKEMYAGRQLDIVKDSAVIACEYFFSSVWFWDPPPQKLSGKITFLHVGPQRIKIRENIVVDLLNRGEKKSFKGKAVFKKELDNSN